MKCPDCNSGLAPEATKCRCGWAAFADSTGAPRQRCDIRGCDGAAFIRMRYEGVMQNVCLRCYEGSRNTEAFAFCKAEGLNTVADMRAYCARISKNLFRAPSFERWANSMTQESVDTLVRMGGKSDEHALERLRSMGVIDEAGKLVPMDARQARREAHEARVRAERERIEAILKQQGVVRNERAPDSLESDAE